MRITLVYDNTSCRKDLQPDWGFSCHIEMDNAPTILFDTGASGTILLDNMEKLGVDPSRIDLVVISHAHWDHTGGLPDLLRVNDRVKLYLPTSFHKSFAGGQAVEVKHSMELCQNVYSTGQLTGEEQSMVVGTEKGVVVIAGCSHPGVGPILKAASGFGKVYALIGGLHGFREFALLENLHQVCACHCTQHQSEIKRLYPEKWLDGGVGKVIEI